MGQQRLRKRRSASGERRKNGCTRRRSGQRRQKGGQQRKRGRWFAVEATMAATSEKGVVPALAPLHTVEAGTERARGVQFGVETMTVMETDGIGLGRLLDENEMIFMGTGTVDMIVGDN
jgi:hypothetical protein